MDSIITALVVIVVAAISTWLQKRNQERQERLNPKPPQTTARTGTPPTIGPRTVPKKATSWEDELRRLLGDESAPPPPARPTPVQPRPTIVVSPRPTAAPTPTLAPAPAPRRITPVIVTTPQPLIRPTLVTQDAPLATLTGAAKVEQTVKDLGAMEESRRAYERARQLEAATASRIESAITQPVGKTSVVRRQISPEAAQVTAMFRNPRSARQAVIAAFILGPPKSLEMA